MSVFKIINVSKEYTVVESIDEVSSRLHDIVSAKFNSSRYSTFGNVVSSNPQVFLIMAKWVSLGRPLFAELNSTKIYAKLFSIDGKTKIAITVKSNPAIIFFFALLILISLVKLITHSTGEDLKTAGSCFLASIGFLLFDRFIKNIVIASFETDMKL